MSNTWDLQRLQDKREEILKAELFMLLHDIGKLHAGHQGKFIRKNRIIGYKHDIDILNIFRNDLKQWECNLGDSYVTKLSTVIEKHHKKNISQSSDGVMVVYAQRIDRLDSAWDRDSVVSPPSPRESDEEKKKKWKQLRLTQALNALVDTFSGFSIYAYKRCQGNRFCLNYDKTNLLPIPPTTLLEKALYTAISVIDHAHQKRYLQNYKHRQIMFKAFHLSMRVACGDTRLSVNDISLWDHSISTAILYKILSAWLVGIHPKNNKGAPLSPSNDESFRKNFRPQLLPLRIDGLAYLAQSNNVPDLLARRARLQKVYDTWQDILEWEFPLAGEVYRDENGPVFLTFLRDKEWKNEEGKNVISLDKLDLPKDEDKNCVLSNAYNGAKKLEKYLRRAIVHCTQGDLTLPSNIELHTYTQKRDENGKSLGDLLCEEQAKGLWLQADTQCLESSWQKMRRKALKGEEVCSVCGLRPQGFGRWYVVEISGTEEEDHLKQGKERRAKQKEALREWLRHYQNEHRPHRRWEEKTEEERECQVCKAISRKMCGVCLERREKRAKPWVKGIHLDAKKRFRRGYPETVWLDEVADENGRLALIVGYFPLENWLDGTLIESLAMFKNDEAKSEPPNREITVYDENDKSVDVVLGPKPVSYSRIRRVWETTRRFWQDVAPTDTPPEGLQKLFGDLQKKSGYGLKLEDLWEGPLSLEECLAGQTIKKRPRLFLKVKDKPSTDLGPYHAYELEIQGRKVAVLWVPETAKDEEGNALRYRGGFWVIENLDYLDNVYGRSFQELVEALAGQPLKVYEPTEYGRPGQTVAIFELEAILPKEPQEKEKVSYTPLIPILAEPRTFMALVPANKAFEVVKAIKTKYEREMGKVRNRLPLHLGIVYAYRKMPLRAIMDAGRRMLHQRWKNLEWEICEDDRGFIACGRKINTQKNLDENALEDEYKEIFKDNNSQKITSQFGKWHRIVIRQEILEKENQSKNQNQKLGEENYRYAVWYLPAKMGDGETEDYWYPYVYWKQDKDGNTNPSNTNREINCYYRTPNPFNLDQNGKPKEGWLVHAGELEIGDKIYFTPATFDFEFLETNVRRFEVHYDERGKRYNFFTRPYLLDEIAILEEIWKFITKKNKNGKPRLSSSQIFAIRNTIEAKREEWFENFEDSVSDESFKEFCKALFINAQWQWGKPKPKEIDWLTDMAARGYFTDAIYLFHHIMKWKIGDFLGG